MMGGSTGAYFVSDVAVDPYMRRQAKRSGISERAETGEGAGVVKETSVAASHS